MSDASDEDEEGLTLPRDEHEMVSWELLREARDILLRVTPASDIEVHLAHKIHEHLKECSHS